MRRNWRGRRIRRRALNGICQINSAKDGTASPGGKKLLSQIIWRKSDSITKRGIECCLGALKLIQNLEPSIQRNLPWRGVIETVCFLMSKTQLCFCEKATERHYSCSSRHVLLKNSLRPTDWTARRNHPSNSFSDFADMPRRLRHGFLPESYFPSAAPYNANRPAWPQLPQRRKQQTNRGHSGTLKLEMSALPDKLWRTNSPQ